MRIKDYITPKERLGTKQKLLIGRKPTLIIFMIIIIFFYSEITTIFMRGAQWL